MPMTREEATAMVERLLAAAGAYNRDTGNYSKQIHYFAAREDVINALMGGTRHLQGEA